MENYNSNLIKENFFIIDSNNLRNIKSHMYGFCVSKKGILTDNYYKKIKDYEYLEPEGVYIMIRKLRNNIKIYQDFYGSVGLYLFENKETGYFAISNSFLLLQEYLIGKQNLTLNKDFADDLIIEELCTPSIYETLIKEINKLPSNGFITINIAKKTFNFNKIDYKENTISLDSKEGLLIIDKWIDKWGFIIRSLYKLTDNIGFDLSGGFDTRSVLALLLNSGINIKNILIRSSNDKLHVHEEDFKIASNISSFYGFKLNAFKLDDRGKIFTNKDSLFCSIYTKLGIHKEFNIKKKFYDNPRFIFTGSGGEIIRGYPGKSIEKYMKILSKNSRNIKDQQKELHDSTIRLCNRSIELLKKTKKYKNGFEIAKDLYYKGRTRSHYGKAAYESFIANIYSIQPLLDSDILKLKLDIKDGLALDIPAYIYVRFAYNLIKFPFEGKRFLYPNNIIKAINLNNQFESYKKKSDFNLNFYIDIQRKIPTPSSKYLKYNIDVNKYINDSLNLNKIYYYINKIYNDSIYNWAIDNINKSKFFPLRHIYSLLAIAKTLEDISINHLKLGIYQDINKRDRNKKLFE